MVGLLLTAMLAAGTAPCPVPEGETVVVRTDEALVTVARRGEYRDPLQDTLEETWYGCAEGTGTRFELEAGRRSLGGSRYAEGFELAGPFAGYLLSSGDKYATLTRLVTVDLRGNERWMSTDVSSFGGTGFTEHAVNRRGDAAWVRTAYGRRGRLQHRLFVRHDGRVVRRDTATRPLTRLRLTGTRVYWREGGRRRSRPLAPRR